MQPNSQAQPYMLVGGNASAVAAGGQIALSMSNNSGGDFYVRRIKVIPRLSSAGGGGALAGTPLPSTPSSTDASNTMPPTSLVTINLKIGTNQLFSQPISVAALMGLDGDGYWFPDVLPLVSSRQDVQVSGTNGTASAINLEVVMFGFSVPAGSRAFE